MNRCAEERARDSLEPLAAEAREKWRTRFAEKHRFPREKLHDVVGGGSVDSRGIERSGHLHHLWPWARLPRRRRQGVATGIGRRTGTNAIGWLAGLVARLPLPWRAVQGQTHPLSLQAAVAAAVSEESALLAAIAVASCCC